MDLDLLTPAQAADLLNISTKTLRAHVKAGEIAFITVGLGVKRQRMVFSQQDILDFINRHRIRQSPPTSAKQARSTLFISDSTVVGFTALRAQRDAEKLR